MDDESTTDDQLALPGFRFHPTEEELVDFYLKNAMLGKKLRFNVIGFLNIYHHDPSELPGLARIGEREWYFFVPRDRKNGSGGRPNRTTKKGFWKATGSDRRILSLSDPRRVLGLKKTLVFYKGRAPRGSKTDWVMNEFRLPDSSPSPKDIVLCKIYRKATSMKVLEQRAAKEQEARSSIGYQYEHDRQIYRGLLLETSPPMTPPAESVLSVCGQGQEHAADLKKEFAELEDKKSYINEEVDAEKEAIRNGLLQLPWGMEKLPELQVPRVGMDWGQDPLWAQLRSPWLDNLTPPYANVLNF